MAMKSKVVSRYRASHLYGTINAGSLILDSRIVTPEGNSTAARR